MLDVGWIGFPALGNPTSSVGITMLSFRLRVSSRFHRSRLQQHGLGPLNKPWRAHAEWIRLPSRCSWSRDSFRHFSILQRQTAETTDSSIRLCELSAVKPISFLTSLDKFYLSCYLDASIPRQLTLCPSMSVINPNPLCDLGLDLVRARPERATRALQMGCQANVTSPVVPRHTNRHQKFIDKST
jgi:hypothetical protein